MRVDRVRFNLGFNIQSGLRYEITGDDVIVVLETTGRSSLVTTLTKDEIFFVFRQCRYRPLFRSRRKQSSNSFFLLSIVLSSFYREIRQSQPASLLHAHEMKFIPTKTRSSQSFAADNKTATWWFSRTENKNIQIYAMGTSRGYQSW